MVRISEYGLVIVSMTCQIFLVGLAAYLIHRTREYSLPTSSTFLTSIISLPILSLILYGSAIFLSEQNGRFYSASIRKLNRPTMLIFMFVAFTIYETVMATLAGTMIAPESSLACELDQRWSMLFRQKDVRAIKMIQDALGCCGLRTPVDRAWPFPAKGVAADACQTAFSRNKSCFEPWKREEQFVGRAVVFIAAIVFLGRLIFLRRQWRYSSWLPRYAERSVTGNQDDGRRIQGPANYRSIEDSRPTVVGSQLYDAENANWSNSQERE